MRFKLDENFGFRCQSVFTAHGHDVETVLSEKIQGCADQNLYEICCKEGRCLVTLDLDFANILRFPPEKSNGIAVLRVPKNPSLKVLDQLVIKLISTLNKFPLEKKLWVVEVDRVRIHEGEGDSES